LNRTAGLVLLGTLSSLLTSCTGPGPGALDAAAIAAIQHGVRDMASSISRDVGREGPDAWLRYFVEGPEFFMASDGKLQFSNFGDADAVLRAFSRGVAHLELTWDAIRIDPLAPGLAAMASSYGEVFTDPKGHTTRFNGYFTGTAVETPSGWKLRDAHWSSLPPPH
jgi:hypothetical protein